jgi:branched-chain amino acid transport system permease protein
MLRRSTFNLGLYIAIAVIILTLSGIFETFRARVVIQPDITLSTILLLGVFVGVGYFTAARAHADSAAAKLVNGGVGGALIGLALALLVWLQVSLAAIADINFVFPNFAPLLGSPVTFGQSDLSGGLALLMLASLIGGLTGGLLVALPGHLRRVILSSVILTIVIGLLEAQVNRILSLPDSLTLALTFALGYGVAVRLASATVPTRLAIGAVAGLIAGLVVAGIGAGGGAAEGGILYGTGNVPLHLAALPLPVVAVAYAVLGVLGALVTGAARTIHNGAVSTILSLVILGVLNWQGAMTLSATLLILALLLVVNWFLPALAEPAAVRFDVLERPAQRGVQRFAFVGLLLLLLIAPAFTGQYITNVFNLVGLYIIMGLGLNITVGYAGLLDLGYVSFFAIGAYTAGILTTPSIITCGGIHPEEITPDQIATACTVLTFWQALPIAIVMSALAGLAIGTPILRLRGDYLAIVTLGFGQIIGLIVKFDDFKPLLGAAQGIASVPRPVIDLTALNPAWRFELSGEAQIYYLILIGVILTSVIALRLGSTRPGRAWRAMRADEDVAQANGVNLTRAKLMAFAFGAAFAGLAGAISATRLFGVYPDSFTLFVSINVLSLIIIGGLGSIPGVIIGAFMLVGLPEVLRELDAYRLLAFGVLLVIAMLVKPEGLLPPQIRMLAQGHTERTAGAAAEAVQKGVASS